MDDVIKKGILYEKATYLNESSGDSLQKEILVILHGGCLVRVDEILSGRVSKAACCGKCIQTHNLTECNVTGKHIWRFCGYFGNGKWFSKKGRLIQALKDIWSAGYEN